MATDLEIDRYAKTHLSSFENAKHRSFVDWALGLPWDEWRALAGILADNALYPVVDGNAEYKTGFKKPWVELTEPYTREKMREWIAKNAKTAKERAIEAERTKRLSKPYAKWRTKRLAAVLRPLDDWVVTPKYKGREGPDDQYQFDNRDDLMEKHRGMMAQWREDIGLGLEDGVVVVKDENKYRADYAAGTPEAAYQKAHQLLESENRTLAVLKMSREMGWPEIPKDSMDRPIYDAHDQTETDLTRLRAFFRGLVNSPPFFVQGFDNSRLLPENMAGFILRDMHHKDAVDIEVVKDAPWIRHDAPFVFRIPNAGSRFPDRDWWEFAYGEAVREAAESYPDQGIDNSLVVVYRDPSDPEGRMRIHVQDGIPLDDRLRHSQAKATRGSIRPDSSYMEFPRWSSARSAAAQRPAGRRRRRHHGRNQPQAHQGVSPPFDRGRR